jgi:hypothetical protein
VIQAPFYRVEGQGTGELRYLGYLRIGGKQLPPAIAQYEVTVARGSGHSPILSMRPGIPERQTHDYARHGVTCRFAALNTATGQVTDACYPRHRHQEVLRVLKKIAAAHAGQRN